MSTLNVNIRNFLICQGSKQATALSSVERPSFQYSLSQIWFLLLLRSLLLLLLTLVSICNNHYSVTTTISSSRISAITVNAISPHRHTSLYSPKSPLIRLSAGDDSRFAPGPNALSRLAINQINCLPHDKTEASPLVAQ